ncbi:unnamed protein product, partial [Meganyctiphanes norvegica]
MSYVHIPTGWDGDAWSGATLQSDEGWLWLDGTQVQNNAWNDGEPNGNGFCSRFEGSSVFLYESLCSETQPTLCQVVPAPSAPILTVLDTTSSSLNVTWTKDSDVISKYIVTCNSAADEFNSTVYNVTTLVVTGLLCNTEYRVTVTAYTDINNFASSSEVNATTNDEVPGKPVIQQIDQDDNNPTKLVVSWTEAEYKCSEGLLNYQITWQTGDYTLRNNTLDGTTYNYTITNLLSDTMYTVSVAGRSDTGILGPMDSEIVNTTSTALCQKKTRFPEICSLWRAGN